MWNFSVFLSGREEDEKKEIKILLYNVKVIKYIFLELENKKIAATCFVIIE